MLNSTMFDSINYEKNNKIINVNSGEIYNNNVLIRDTDIINGTLLLLV